MPQTLRTPEHFKVKDPTQNCSEVGSEEISTPEHNFSTSKHEILTIRKVTRAPAVQVSGVFSHPLVTQIFRTTPLKRGQLPNSKFQN